jgi:hypothetical protein
VARQHHQSQDQAYRLLQVVFIIAPIIAAADKFAHLLVNWDKYLAPAIARLSPIGGHGLMGEAQKADTVRTDSLVERRRFEPTVLFSSFLEKGIAENMLEMLVRIRIALANEIRTNGALLKQHA